jgi:S-adenosylmethionine:tRNA ribosyltransferase-isomerase
MKLSDFDYDLPESFIAQIPAEPRDSSRLMVLNRADGSIGHYRFREIVNFINPGDVLVMNDTRVIPARLAARRIDTGGALEILLLRQINDRRWQVIVGGKRAAQGTQLAFEGVPDITATVVEEMDDSERVIEFSDPVNDRLAAFGQAPLPPYIHTPLEDAERYQTIYSRIEGSAAAPTAGLHFTPELLLTLREMGVHLAYCTLNIGLDTFMPVRADHIENHKIHSERAVLTVETANMINEAKLAGGRVIAVGTTSARTLETAAILSAGDDPARPFEAGEICGWRPVMAFEGDTSLFIYPGYTWRAVDALITNFHLPKSSLLLMISALAGRDFVLQAYETAKREGYRFFSFGDAMLIL